MIQQWINLARSTGLQIRNTKSSSSLPNSLSSTLSNPVSPNTSLSQFNGPNTTLDCCNNNVEEVVDMDENRLS